MNAETRQTLAAAFKNRKIVIEPCTDAVLQKYVAKINGKIVAKVYKSFDSNFREIEIIRYPRY